MIVISQTSTRAKTVMPTLQQQQQQQPSALQEPTLRLPLPLPLPLTNTNTNTAQRPTINHHLPNNTKRNGPYMYRHEHKMELKFEFIPLEIRGNNGEKLLQDETHV